jgi:hypothetical protein
MQASSETIAGDGVADREREEDECDGDHGDIQHEMILSTPTVIESKLLCRGARNRAELRLLKRLQPSGLDELPLAPYVFEVDRRATV